MKRSFVYLIVACVSLSSAQDLSSRRGDSDNVQPLVKFSGTLVDTERGSIVGPVTLKLMMYNEPFGGEPYWQETQTVHPDAHGRYTVLLGEKTPRGLPGAIFARGREHWLGVQISGQREQQRILLAEFPSMWKGDPINDNTPVSKKASSSNDWYLALILSIMFLAGVALAYSEVVKWWKARMARFEPPPFANLITYIRSSDTRWRATQVLWFPLPRRTFPGRLQPSVPSVEEDRLKAA